MTQPLLEISGLDAGYGQTQVLRGVSLKIPDLARVGLFGPNGHGKTTLLRAISGLLRPWSGQITFSGTRVDQLRPGNIVERGIVHVPQGNTLFPKLTVGETLSLGSYARRARANAKNNLDLVLTLFPRLAERRGQLCGTLSGGERQMLSIGLGVLTSPRLLILDEPTLGLAPRIKDELCDAIRRLSEQDMPLIVVEQDVEFLTGLADRLFMMEHGSIVLEVPPGGRLNHEEIMALYFGQQAETGEGRTLPRSPAPVSELGESHVGGNDGS
jgi:branched-chain amino acid transport system ATP-binding protein